MGTSLIKGKEASAPDINLLSEVPFPVSVDGLDGLTVSEGKVW